MAVVMTASCLGGCAQKPEVPDKETSAVEHLDESSNVSEASEVSAGIPAPEMLTLTIDGEGINVPTCGYSWSNTDADGKDQSSGKTYRSPKKMLKHGKVTEDAGIITANEDKTVSAQFGDMDMPDVFRVLSYSLEDVLTLGEDVTNEIPGAKEKGTEVEVVKTDVGFEFSVKPGTVYMAEVGWNQTKDRSYYGRVSYAFVVKNSETELVFNESAIEDGEWHFSENETVTDEHKEMLTEALKDFTGMTFTAKAFIAYKSAEGMDYCFLCRAPFWCMVQVHKDAEGTVTPVSVKAIEPGKLYGNDGTLNFGDIGLNSAGGSEQMGLWTVMDDEEKLGAVLEKADIQDYSLVLGLSERKLDVEAIEYDYALLMLDVRDNFVLVYLAEDAEGNVDIVNTEDVDVEKLFKNEDAVNLIGTMVSAGSEGESGEGTVSASSEEENGNSESEWKPTPPDPVAPEFEFTVTDTSKTLYAATALNIREKPSTDYGIIGTYAFGDKITVTGECDNGWMRVDYNGTTGYSSGSLMSETVPEYDVLNPPAEGTQSTKPTEETQNTQTTESKEWFSVTDKQATLYAATDLNIREKPSTDYGIIGTYAFGDEITVTGECDNGWMRVSFNGMTGYSSGNLMSETVPEYDVLNPPANESASSGSVMTNGPIRREEGVYDSVFYNTIYYYGLLPANVRSGFEASGWEILIVSSDLGAMFGYSYTIKGYCSFTNSKLYIDNRDSAPTSVIHELGHFMDGALAGKPSYTDEFANIHAEEMNAFAAFYDTHPNNYSTTTEYFAESFEAYVLYPDGLKQNCPKTYDYLTKVLGSF